MKDEEREEELKEKRRKAKKKKREKRQTNLPRFLNGIIYSVDLHRPALFIDQ